MDGKGLGIYIYCTFSVQHCTHEQRPVPFICRFLETFIALTLHTLVFMYIAKCIPTCDVQTGKTVIVIIVSQISGQTRQVLEIIKLMIIIVFLFMCLCAESLGSAMLICVGAMVGCYELCR